MAELDVDAELVRLTAVRVIVMRDVILRLLAYATRQASDPEKFLKGFSEATHKHIAKADEAARAQKLPVPEAALLADQQRLLDEVDWYIGAARTLAPKLE